MPAPVSTAPLELHPSDEQVAVAWIGSIPAIAELGGTKMVATRLPADVDKAGDPAAWVETGFVTVSVVGGNPDPLLPVNRPVIQVDVWATTPGSNRPPWWQATAISNAIKYACWSRVQMPRPLDITVRGRQYPLAVVQGATLLTTFRRLYEDSADYAHLTGDLWLSWIAPGDVIDY